MNISPVVVCADALGNVIVPTSNPNYGYIRVEQTVSKIVNGWTKNEKRSALISGLITDLQNLDLYGGQIIEGKIVIRESLNPFSKETEKTIKKAGPNGVVCTLNGQPIYRKAFYTTNLEEQDQLIQHDNTEEINQVTVDKVFDWKRDIKF